MKRSVLFTAALLAALTLGGVSAAADNTTATIGLKKSGDISLDSAPDVQFGDQQISSDTKTYSATSVKPAIAVTNPGLPSGWSVTVSRGDFTDGKAGTKLLGPTLTIAAGKVTPSDSGNLSTAPVSSEVTLDAPGSPKTILNAGTSEGIGKFETEIPTESTTLKVPAGNTVGSYAATLTWALTNAPK